MRGTYSNVSSAELRRITAALAANLPPPEEIKPHTLGGLCRHAVDTGKPAFVGLPCRGHRIECRKTGVVTYAARCRDGNCKFYEEKEDN